MNDSVRLFAVVVGGGGAGADARAFGGFGAGDAAEGWRIWPVPVCSAHSLNGFVMISESSRRSVARGNHLFKPTSHYGSGLAFRDELVGAVRANSLFVLNIASQHLVVEFINIEVDGVSFAIEI